MNSHVGSSPSIHELPRPRAALISAIDQALEQGTGLAVGKLGYSEQVWVASQWLKEQSPGDLKRHKAIDATTKFHASLQSGIFPATDSYLAKARSRFIQALQEINFLAVHRSHLSPLIVDKLAFTGVVTDFDGVEPNRHNPYCAKDCYLPSLRGKKLLLVTTPADLPTRRAVKSTFEEVWRDIGCPWFEPVSLSAQSFPSSFDAKTQKNFSTSADLLEEICNQILPRNFDVALIGAGALGLPIAAHVKSLGKVGISLGGHLQVLFGAQGKRWRENPEWQQKYVNDSWIDMPESYKPKDLKGWADNGAYW